MYTLPRVTHKNNSAQTSFSVVGLDTIFVRKRP